MPVITMNQPLVSTLTCPPGKQRIEYCCAELPGLLLEVRPNANYSTWYVRFKTGGKTRYERVGNTQTHTLAQAKQAAIEFKSTLQSQQKSGIASSADSKILTLREFTEQHYLPDAMVKKRSWQCDEQRLNQYLLPLFGDRKMDEITRAEIVKFHLELKGKGLSGATCDHFIKLLRRIYNMAIDLELVQANPMAKFPLFNEPNQVENILDKQQLGKLMAVLHNHPNQRLCRLARFLLATGARLGEALSADWSNIDTENRVWRVLASNSKSKKVISKPLNDSAVQVLAEIEAAQGSREGFLFMNDSTGKPLTSVHKGWKAIRKAAGFPHLRLHDLRHQYASMLVNSGRSLYEVQQILSHSSPQVTQRYAHLSTERLLEAANAASLQLEAASPKLLPALPPEPKTGT